MGRVLFVICAVFAIACVCFVEGTDPFVGNQDADSRYDSECMNLQSKVCNDLPYNRTVFPNAFGHTTQEEADREISNYQPLISVKCSATLKLFLCVMYFPVCTLIRMPLKPCKSLCEENRRGCEPVMKKFNFKWPESLRCDQFKYYSENPLCINDNDTSNASRGVGHGANAAASPGFQCPQVLKLPNKVKVNPLRIGGKDVNCGLPCNTTFFPSQEQRRFARHWVLVWALACFVFTGLSVVTFLLDRTRFQYPERPFVYIIMCYCMISAVYIVGFALGDSVSCAENRNNPNASKLLVRGTNQNTACAILFMVSYFFTMASSLWWLILTFTWLLASSLQWAQESISNLSHYFHFLAWAIPAAMTITLLILGEVEADSLTGICFTGVTNRDILLGFIIIPSSIFLLLGIVFLLVGFASLIKIRRFVKQQSAGRTEKFEKLIMRIGFLGALYIVPACVTLAIWTYEAAELPSWLVGWWQRNCHAYGIQCPSEAAAIAAAAAASSLSLTSSPLMASAGGSGDIEVATALDARYAEAASAAAAAAASSEPRFELIMVKYLMSLIIGISFSLWVWSKKTMKAWCRLMQCRCHTPVLQKPDSPAAAAAVTAANAEFRHPMIATGGLGGGVMLQQQQQQQQQPHQQQALHPIGKMAYYSNTDQRINIL